MKLLKKAVATALAMLMLPLAVVAVVVEQAAARPLHLLHLLLSAIQKRIRLHRAEKARTCMLNIMEQKTTRAARWCRIRVC